MAKGPADTAQRHSGRARVSLPTKDQGTEYRSFARRAVTVTGIAVAVLTLAALLWRSSQVLLAVFGAVLFAVWLDGLALLLAQRIRIARAWALLIVVALLAISLGGFGVLAGTQVSAQLAQLGQRLPQALQELRSLLDAHSWGRALLSIVPAEANWLPSHREILAQISGLFSTALGALVTGVIVVMIGLYLAASPAQYVNGTVRLVPRSEHRRAREVLRYLGHALRWYLVGRMVAMAMVGVLVGVALWAVGMQLVLALALITALLSFVPFLGPVMAAVPALLVAFLHGPLYALYVLGIYTAVQFTEGNILTPLIQVQAVSLPPAALLAAQLLMGVWFGIVGVILAAPLAVVVIVLVQTLYVEDVLGERVEVLGERHHTL